MTEHSNQNNSLTRRDFIKTTAPRRSPRPSPETSASTPADRTRSASASSAAAAAGRARPSTASTAAPGVEVVALFDLFQDRVDSSLKRLQEKIPDKVKVTPETCSPASTDYKKLLALPEVNLIVTAAPPGFRPIHLKAAVEAGKHVFMEKPVAVDPVGVRSVIASSDLAGKRAWPSSPARSAAIRRATSSS